MEERVKKKSSKPIFELIDYFVEELIHGGIQKKRPFHTYGMEIKNHRTTTGKKLKTV
jgi:hypothetical protein